MVNLKEARKKKGYTQKSLAKLMGVTTNYIYMIETGKHIPAVPLAKRLAKELDLMWTEFYED